MMLSKVLLFSLLSLLLVLIPAAKTAGSSFIYAACFPSRYPPNSPFQSSLDSVLTSIANAASQSSYASFAAGNDSSSPPGSAAYGLFQCRADLSSGECSACVQSAVGQVGLLCPNAYSASLQLDGCLLRYADEDFAGKLDTTVVYKKCSPERSAGDGGEFFRRRDDVLGDLGSGQEYFRVSSSGAVEGYAQCVGGLSSGDCTACLSEAVERLRNACGPALAADLFLQQCYARYWTSGYYPGAADAAGYTDDDIGRTVAIIVGILAGVALLVVFISFMKKAC
ncbi:Cysteine-rich repeat secretory protein 15 [Apostasia shenzhenica]|uniref:Cysteine-rich repeat secretory protein 15 n=1 Tax=Apostasia shenzhenica TaxID=1088818 RepID=A0A2I0B8R2_9ASPA|nr:Cysteine-rich repeat secretory protein 15 [Apostasia shenzhenica]